MYNLLDFSVTIGFNTIVFSLLYYIFMVIILNTKLLSLLNTTIYVYLILPYIMYRKYCHMYLYFTIPEKYHVISVMQTYIFTNFYFNSCHLISLFYA